MRPYHPLSVLSSKVMPVILSSPVCTNHRLSANEMLDTAVLVIAFCNMFFRCDFRNSIWKRGLIVNKNLAQFINFVNNYQCAAVN